MMTTADASAQQIVPEPVKVSGQAGRFLITQRTVISTDAASAAVGQQLARYLEPATGINFRVGRVERRRHDRFRFGATATLTRLGDEGYLLDVRASARHHPRSWCCGSLLRGPDAAPAAASRDLPRGRCRRHGVDDAGGVHRGLAAVRVARRASRRRASLHAEGVREEVHRPPRAAQTQHVPLAPDRRPGLAHRDQAVSEAHRGRRLAQGDARRPAAARLVRRSSTANATAASTRRTMRGKSSRTRQARYVTVVPEIEMPGHAMAAIAAYPELGVTGEPVEVARTWGVFSDILNAEPSTVTFMQNVLTEVLAIFPERVHPRRRRRGGQGEVEDERAHPGAHQGAELSRTNTSFRAGSSARWTRFSSARKRRLVGWDEILEGGLAENAVVMSWRGTEGGHRGGARRPRRRDGADQSHVSRLLPVEGSGGASRSRSAASCRSRRSTRSSRCRRSSEPQFAKHVLGAQAQLWTEYMPRAASRSSTWPSRG